MMRELERRQFLLQEDQRSASLDARPQAEVGCRRLNRKDAERIEGRRAYTKF